jgi:gliding motility-associated-like protein
MKKHLYTLLIILLTFSCKKEAVVLPENKLTEIPVPVDTLISYMLSATSFKDTLCLPEAGKIILNADNNNPETAYRWIPGNETGPKKTVSEGGTYTAVRIIKTVSSGQVVISKCLRDTVELKGSPSNIVSGCAGPFQMLKLTYPFPEAGKFFLWLPGQENTSYKFVTTPGIYTLSAFDSSKTDTMTFFIIPCPLATDTVDVTVNSGTNPDCAKGMRTFRLTAPAVNPAADSVHYAWSPGGETSPVVLVSSPGTYKVTVEQFFIDTVSVSVNSCPKPYLFVPNSFSPNGDGYNDTWKIKSSGIKNGIAEVRTAEGVLLFRSESTEPSWDGKYNGRDVPEGAYLYYFSYSDRSGLTKSVKGQLQLRR